MRTFRTTVVSLVVACALGCAAGAAVASARIPTSPYFVLDVSLQMPPLDGVGPCAGGTADVVGATPASDPAAGPKSETDLDVLDPDEPLEAAIRASRRADDPKQALTAWKALSAAMPSAGSPRALACGWLELARLELRIGRIPEARLTAARAAEPFGDDGAPESVRRAIDFYRAESMARSTDPRSALALQERLAKGSDAVARAARVRLADARWVAEPSRANRLELEKRVDASELASPAVWAPHLSEVALQVGDAEAARAWLDRASTSDRPRSTELEAALSIRRADLLYLGGVRKEKEEAQKILHEFAETGRSDSIRRLALVREIDLGKRASDASLARLERTIRLGERRVAAYANEVLARRLVAAERYAEALDAAVEWVHRRADIPGEVVDPALIDEILRGITATGPCETWIEHVGGRRDLLLRNASRAEPFLDLGDCYVEAGMSNASLETYRGIAKAFGPTAVSAVTLRSAQAEFELGRLATARAAARTNVRKGVEPRDAWRLLLARIQLADARPGKALESMRPILQRIAEDSSEAYREDDPVVILLSARAVANAPTATDRSLLRRTLERPFKTHPQRERLTEAALITADLHRQAAEIGVARSLYARALAVLEPGVLRSRAAYWLGVLASHPDEARALWSKVSEDDDPWARLALNEISLSEGRAAVGEPLAVPATRLPMPDRGVSR